MSLWSKEELAFAVHLFNAKETQFAVSVYGWKF